MIGEERLQQIESVAGRLFSRRGYAGTSIRDIARKLKMQGGSLYAHISSKEEVLWRLVERAGREFHQAVGALAVGTGPAPERLRAMARAHVEVVTSDPDHASVFLHEWKYLEGEWQTEVRRLRDEYEDYFSTVIAEGTAAGDFAVEDPRLVTRCLLSALNGIATWYSPDGSLSPEGIADAYWEVFINGLSARPS